MPENEIFKAASELQAALNYITGNAFPHHRWNRFGGEHGYILRLTGAHDTPDSGYTPDSELSKTDYYALAEAFQFLAVAEGVEPPSSSLRVLRFYSSGVSSTDKARPTFGPLTPNQLDDCEHDINWIRQGAFFVKIRLENSHALAKQEAKRDFPAAAKESTLGRIGRYVLSELRESLALIGTHHM